jgi:hypothetical protein
MTGGAESGSGSDADPDPGPDADPLFRTDTGDRPPGQDAVDNAIPSTDDLDGEDTVIPPAGPATPTAIIGRWARDLTFHEVHAFVLGAVPFFLAAFGLVVSGLAGAVVVALAAVAGRVDGGPLAYLIPEAHYVFAGAGVGFLSGAVTSATMGLVMAGIAAI